MENIEHNTITIDSVLEKSSNLRQKIEHTIPSQEQKAIFIPKLNTLLNKYEENKDLIALNTEIEALEKEIFN